MSILGAPGSPAWHPNLIFPDAAEADDVRIWLASHSFDVVHDHSNGAGMGDGPASGASVISTHHLTGSPRADTNVVFLSMAQRNAAGSSIAPVVRLPVNIARFSPAKTKQDYLLFLGRVSPWKGAREAAAFAAAAGRHLILAGPGWEPNYLHAILHDYAGSVTWLNEVGGEERLRLLSEATALLVLSQPVPGPWGGLWSEPGAMVVAEAAASGTPVIATSNGCLAEIAPKVGATVDFGVVSAGAARHALSALPSSEAVRKAAAEWSHLEVADQYLKLYRKVIAGEVLPL